MARQPATVPTQQNPPQEKMTYEEFLDWADEDTYAEWVDGEIVMMSPASRRHRDIAGFLYELLRNYVRLRSLGDVVQAPFQMKLEAGREPNLLFIAEAHLDRLKDTYLDGPADLVVEVVSPERGPRDRGEKFYEYEAGGVSEYWLIDPQREQAEFYQRGDDGRYRPVPTDAHGTYQSHVLADFWLRVDWLRQQPLPAADGVLLEIAGETYAHRLIAQLRERGYLTGGTDNPG